MEVTAIQQVRMEFRTQNCAIEPINNRNIRFHSSSQKVINWCCYVLKTKSSLA